MTTAPPVPAGTASDVVAVALVLAAFLLCWVFPAWFAGRNARAKGYSFGLFFGLTLVFGLLVLIAVAAMPRKRGTTQTAAGTAFVKPRA